jgi:predicted restriction endonuclease
MSTLRTFENCWKFSYVSTNHNDLVFEHVRRDDKWVTEKRDRYGNRLGVSIRSDAEMRPIFNHMHYVAQCEFYSMSQLSDFSVYSI